MTIELSQLIAREYRRLSDAKGGTSIARQGSDNIGSASENNWSLGKPYVDDGLSASRFARKGRADFDQLVADLQSGPTGRTSDFGADILMLWESSRGSRKVGEWVSFIELCESKGVKIWVTTHERLYDPANGRDRKQLIDDANDSEYESYKTHKRVTSTARYEAQDGRPHGKAPDGLMPVYSDKTGKLETWVENPARSTVPKELFRLLEGGHSIRSIETRFRKAGHLNLAGKPFSHQHLREMAKRHAYAGLRVHHGEVYEGVWDGIVAPERFWAVQGILNDPSRKTTRGGRAVHDLTGRALLCSRCGRGSVVVPSSKSKDLTYRCEGSCVHIKKDVVDDEIIGTEERPGVLLVYLARPDIHDLLAAPGSDDETVRKLKADLAKERAELKEMKGETAATLTEVRVLARSIEAKEATVAKLRDQVRDLTTPAAVLNFLQFGQNAWESWQEAPVSARREVVRVVMSPRYLGQVYIHPSVKDGRRLDDVDRIEWRRAPAGAELSAGQ